MKKKSLFSLLVILVAVVMLGSFALAGSVDLEGNALMIIADVEDRDIIKSVELSFDDVSHGSFEFHDQSGDYYWNPGNIYVGDELTADISVTNTGNVNVTIELYAVSFHGDDIFGYPPDGCDVTVPPAITVGVGDTVAFNEPLKAVFTADGEHVIVIWPREPN